jgi:hypothetical protein
METRTNCKREEILMKESLSFCIETLKKKKKKKREGERERERLDLEEEDGKKTSQQTGP